MTTGKAELPAWNQSSTTVLNRLYNKGNIPIKVDLANLTEDKSTIQSSAVDDG